jgi:hypothetical protein
MVQDAKGKSPDVKSTEVQALKQKINDLEKKLALIYSALQGRQGQLTQTIEWLRQSELNSRIRAIAKTH